MAMTHHTASHAAAVCGQPWAMPHELPSVWQAGNAMFYLPFDAMRNQYACAVSAGLVRRSMLASRDFEQAVDALEHLTLGPLARNV